MNKKAKRVGVGAPTRSMNLLPSQLSPMPENKEKGSPMSIPALASFDSQKIAPLSLRPREAARVLGISPRHLWQLTKDGEIPAVRLGLGKRQTVLYPVKMLADWLASSCTTPTEKAVDQ